jgi:hypothetical protein
MAAAHLRATFGAGGGPRGYIDEVTAEPDGGRALRGWAWDGARGAPADLVVLYLDGRPVGVAPVCLPRADAARSMGSPTEDLGFAIPLPQACGAVTPDRAAVMAWAAGSSALLSWAEGYRAN